MSRQSLANDGKALVGTGITSVACPARGDCALSGGYVDAFSFLVFAAGQHAGRWTRAEAVPGDAALVGSAEEADGDEILSGPFLSQVSCSSPGNCAVAGNYQVNQDTDPGGGTRALVADERAGVWRQVHPISGPAMEAVLAISCPPAAAGNCAAGGEWENAAQASGGAMVASENGGVWGPAQLLHGDSGGITTMSCPAAGYCVAGGSGSMSGSGELAGSGSGPRVKAFLVSERDGRWGSAHPVPGLRGLSGRRRRGSAVDSVVCVAVGDCTVGGSYADASGGGQVFVAAERRGVWGHAHQLPGLAALNRGRRAELSQVSCAAPGSCAAGGGYGTRRGQPFQQAWVATEVRGRWRKAVPVPGTAALNTAGIAAVTSVSCAAADCMAGGWYTTGGTRHQHAFLATERRGRWGTAVQPPGLAALNTGDQALVSSVSCARSGGCAAVGGYFNYKTTEYRMFVISQR